MCRHHVSSVPAVYRPVAVPRADQDVETNRPVSADTLFRIASMTKAFTALSILKLRAAHPGASSSSA
jgi:hypothetical protein